MRRKDRQVTDQSEIMGIIDRCDVCHIALFDKQYPYIVTMNFGVLQVDGITELYFHCASEGKKLDLIRRDPHVAFEMDCSHHLIRGERACSYTMEFESVCGTGVMEIMLPHERLDAMAAFMRHYTAATPPINDKELEGVCVLKLTVQEITAKRLVKQNAS